MKEEKVKEKKRGARVARTFDEIKLRPLDERAMNGRGMNVV